MRAVPGAARMSRGRANSESERSTCPYWTVYPRPVRQAPRALPYA